MVTLSSPVSVLYGIGPEAERKLTRLDIHTVYDLISYIPRRYNDWSNVKSISEIEEGQEISFIATITTTPARKGYKRTAPVGFYVSDGNDRVEVSFFNAPYVVTKFERGDKCFIHGMVSGFGGRPQIVNPYIEKLEKVDGMSLVRPVYSLTAGITSNQLSKWIKTALSLVVDSIPDVVPDEICEASDLMSAKEAYTAIHFPETLEQAARARQRLAYEELILLGIGMKKFIHSDGGEEIAPVVVPSGALPGDIAKSWKKILDNLGFSLTDDQRNSLRDIQRDLMSNKPMNRLVQGDVGSGKTAVAILSMAITALMGKQSVLLAPTSVLARQHYESAMALLKGSGINVVLLMGNTKAALKREIKEKLKSNEASVIIGTHALLSDDIEFADLALVIADEQHRFGVKQRSKLLISRSGESGINSVHNLVMTATPIPRTLAMVIYGDMDTSVIRQKPAGRKEVKTHFLPGDKKDELIRLIRGVVSKGEQVYIVAPRISDEEDDLWVDDYYDEENSSIELTSVKEMMKFMVDSGIANDYQVAMLYGSMKENSKLEIMESFISREVQILISTTVIEVGVNNPNATLMIVMDADRFGLSTLHQLRGRIGRGDKQSYCILVSKNRSDKALSRMKLMCECSDGFELAGQDLELRGPGDFFGTRQHGIPSLRAANLFTDAGIAKHACEVVNNIFEQGGPEATNLYNSIEKMFKLRFGDRINSL